MDKETLITAINSILLVLGNNLIIASSLFINLAYWSYVLIAILILDSLLIGLVIVGIFRYKKVKDKDKEAVTMSRKIFNIVSGLLATLFIILFDPIFSIFVLISLTFAFGYHELIYAGFKKDLWFTKILNALGRQSEEYSPYYASFMALLSSTIILSIEAPLLLYFKALYLPIDYKWIVMFIYTTTVLIWGIGDTMAFIFGTKYGKHKLPWNKKKSLEGLLVNVGISTLISFVFLGMGFVFLNLTLFGIVMCWSILSVPFYILTSIIGGISGGLFESLELKIDDNLITPLLTGVTLTILLNFLLVI